MDALNVALQEWSAFFSATLGAAAALAGLLFVGLSLNLPKNLAYPALPDRALLAVLLLVAVMVLSAMMLVPNQEPRGVGEEILLVGGIVWIAGTSFDIRDLYKRQYYNMPTFVGDVIFFQACLLHVLFGGFLLFHGDLAGLQPLSWGLILSFVKATLDAWVLLVEVNR